MEIETLYRCIDKYLQGEATELEISRIDRWYESFDRRLGFTNEEKRHVQQKGDLIFFQLLGIADTGNFIISNKSWN